MKICKLNIPELTKGSSLKVTPDDEGYDIQCYPCHVALNTIHDLIYIESDTEIIQFIKEHKYHFLEDELFQ